MRLVSHSRSRSGRIWLWLLIGLVVIAIVAGIASHQQAESLAEGDKLYTAGKQAEAVEKYNSGYPSAGTRKAEILKRIVDFHAGKGDKQEAAIWIAKGLDEKVEVNYDAAGQQLLAQAKKERDEKVAQKQADKEAKANAPKKGVNRANYEKIQDGMTLEEVESILGKGKEDARAGNLRTMTWQGGIVNLKVVSITFEDGRVSAKAILD